MTGWRRSPRVAVGVIAAFAIVQLAIPISRFGSPDTVRFGWQMFSTYEPDPGFIVETDTGSTEVDLEEYMARVRSDIDITSLMPAHLCSVVPGAEEVTWNGGSLEC